MRRSHSIVVAAGLTLILAAQILYTLMLASPDGIRIRSPEASVPLGRSFIVSGDAWMRAGIERIEVTISLADRTGSSPLTFPAARDLVRHRGESIFPLSTWSARIELPSDGRWEIRAAASAPDGRQATTAGRTVSVRAGTMPREFRSWSPEHLIPLVIILVASIGMGLIARGSRRGQAPALPGGPRFDRIAFWMSLVLWANELAYQLYWFLIGGWSAATALMLQMCGLSILLLPVMLFSESPRIRQFLFDLLYFWGIGGALQALIAPDIGSSGFPAYRYFSFFLSHGLIVASTVVMAMAGGLRITVRSFLRALVVTNILLIPVYGIDQLLRLIPPYDPGNYFVLGYPPPTGSVVDLFAEIFGPSPRYVVGLELMGLAVFGLLYMPWPLARLARKKGRNDR
ncbi:MAG: TIGR02206 family membrane protein [Spirochaetes bacterium]|nr:TIGR02206 family membrane protein [Spirochaetota bacterium]